MIRLYGDMSEKSHELSVVPYLTLSGSADAAMALYVEVLGAEVEMCMRFRESPEPAPEGMLAAGWEEKVMHASLKIGASRVFLSDGCSGEDEKPTGFMLHVSLPSEEECDRVFEALGEGGRVTMPLGPTFWAKRFGMLADRFGVGWMISTVESEG